MSDPGEPLCALPLAVLDGLPVLLCALDRDHRFVLLNAPYARWAGVERDAALGRTIQEVLHRPPALGAQPFMARVTAGETVEFETTAPFAGGERHVRCRMWPRRVGGEIDGLWCAVEDITAQVGADEALASALDGVADAYLGVDPAWRVTSFNRAAEAFFQRSRADVVGQDIDVIWPGARQSASGRLLAQVMETRAAARQELPSLSRPGAVFNLDVVPLSAGGVGVVIEDVTERRRMEHELHVTAERYRLAAKATNDAIWDWDLAASRIIWNDAVGARFGHWDAVEGTTAQWWLDQIHPDDHAEVEETIFGVIRGQDDSWSAEYRFRCANGAYAEVFDRGTVLRDAEGRAVRMIGAMLDLTERKQAEAALRASEASFRSRLNAIPQMVWSTRADGYHDFFNDRWYEFTGVPAGSTDGDGWADVFHPEDQERIWAVWRESLETGKLYDIEYRLRHRSGEYRWVLGRALPTRNEAGEIIRWMGTCTDIHEFKRATDELRRASALLRLIGDSTPDMIYAKDRRSRVIYANAAVTKVVGRPLEEILGHSDADWAPDPADAEAILANDQQVMTSGQVLDVDEVFTGPDGQVRYYRSVKAPLIDGAGETIGLVGTTSDMTDRRRAAERERLLAREVDHRAKNLLAVVQSVVRLTRETEVTAFAEAVTGRIHSLARAHSLLAASRWEGADLRTMIREELEPFVDKVREVSSEGPALRLTPEAAQILALVIHELATNAAKYGALSTPEGRLQVRWTTDLGAGEAAMLKLDWCERGGPATSPPRRRGFGSTVLRMSIERQLRGRVRLDWGQAGLTCELTIPLANLTSEGPATLPDIAPG
ncbi:PAS domain-containing protein [Phenylobacterium deserti]|nr:PAS domain-containing protein [Phenylobacterium deserti]